MKIFVSGVCSDLTSPSLGIAKSIRLAFPRASIVYVGYSKDGLGVYHEVFDEIEFHPLWDEIQFDVYKQYIQKSLISPETFWFSGLDFEIIWLSQNLNFDKKIPISSYDEVTRALQSSIISFKEFPFFIPPRISLTESDWDLHKFCRKLGWKVVLKSLYHEPLKINSWEDFESTRKQLKQALKISNSFLQAYIEGYSESIAFCAYKGELIDCVYMRRQNTIHDSELQFNQVSELPLDLYHSLKDVVRELNWTGGSELKLVRDNEDKLWFLDWNIKFPDWVYGATLAGHNLPAKLLSEMGDYKIQNPLPQSQQFTQIMIEVPVRKDSTFQLSYNNSSKNINNQNFAHIYKTTEYYNQHKLPETLSPIPEIMNELSKLDIDNINTPFYFTAENLIYKHFITVQELVKQASLQSNLSIKVAYSLKTNPTASIIQIAYKTGMLAEAISQLEVKRACQAGFSLDHIILNGPSKFWSVDAKMPIKLPRYVFCDSINELSMLSENIGRQPNIAGIRISRTKVNSRFGISLENPECYRDLISQLKHLKGTDLGVHFHSSMSSIGVEGWWELFNSVIESAHHLQQNSKKKIRCLDLGGGWFPDDWLEVFLPQLSKHIIKAQRYLPHLNEVILEPGQALVQPFGLLIVRVLEVRKNNGTSKEIIVDGSIAELPDSYTYPHRILFRRKTGEWEMLNKGEDRILGRLCMEGDILNSNICLPDEIREGDFLSIADAGAYDKSMSFVFGQG